MALLDCAFEMAPDDPLRWLEDHPPEDASLLKLAREVLQRAHEERGILERSLGAITRKAMRGLASGPGKGTQLGSYVLEEEIGQGRAVSSGVYFVHLEGVGGEDRAKVVLVR